MNKNISWKQGILSFFIILIFQIVSAIYGLMWLNAIGFCAYLVAPFLFWKQITPQGLGFSKPKSWKSVIIGILVCISLLPCEFFMSAFLVGNNTGNFFVVVSMNHIKTFQIQSEHIWNTFFLSALSLSIFSPLTEEIFFRGFLQKSFENSFGIHKANVLQALCFGIIHIAYCWIVKVDIRIVLNVVPCIALIGLVYGWVRHKTKSIFSVIIVHAVTNFFLTILIYSWQIAKIL